MAGDAALNNIFQIFMCIFIYLYGKAISLPSPGPPLCDEAYAQCARGQNISPCFSNFQRILSTKAGYRVPGYTLSFDSIDQVGGEKQRAQT